jgi:hypothetical protein
MRQEKQELKAFWDSFIRAVEAEPHEVERVQGASGLYHQITALGLDKSRHRLIVVTGEDGTRASILVQADLQSAFKSVQVITVRAVESSASDDSALEDRKAGLCSVQLTDFSPDEIELFSSGLGLEAIRDVLRRHHLLQYFFPAPDHLALGLIESKRIRLLHQLIDQLVRTPDFGHPFGPMELMPPQYSFTEMVRELQNLGLMTEREDGLEMTIEGLKVRAVVRDKPREALVFKTLNRISSNLYLKSLLHPDLLRHD